MAQPVRQIGVRAPGFQGLNTELSPLNGDPEFALVADNVVVDQIGRLVSRKAFADYSAIGEPDDVFIQEFNQSSEGMYCNSPIETSRGRFTWDQPAGTPTYLWNRAHDMTIHIDEMKAFVDGNFDEAKSSYEILLRIIMGRSGMTPLFPSATSVTFPASLGVIEISQGGTVLYTEDLDVTAVLKETLTPDGGFWYYWEYTVNDYGRIRRVATTTPDVPVLIRFTPDPGVKECQPSFQGYIWNAYIEINGIADGGRGYNEIINLGNTNVDGANVHEQHDQNVVMVYRYGDGFEYPDTTTKSLPVGMGRKAQDSRLAPNLTGTIEYATAILVDDETEELFLPAGWGGTNQEALLTAEIVTFKDEVFLFAKGQPFLRLGPTNPFVWEEVVTSSLIDGDIAISAYGRLWVSGVGGDYHTIWYSTLLDESKWYTTDDPTFNDGGVIDVREYWPVDGDTIVNIHAHNGFLLVFGRNSILVFANANSGSPAGIINQEGSGIFLQDTISNVGLVRRDAICNIGTDVLFVDDSGLRSIGRVIQEKSNPLQEPSINIRREIQQIIELAMTGNIERSAIKLSYVPSESLAILLFGELRIAYVFHLNMPSKTGGMKVTRWTGCFWNDCIEVKEGLQDSVYMAGKPSKGLLRYDGYLQGNNSGVPTPYIMRYESMALAMGDSPMQTAIPKSIHYVCMGEFVPGQANALWGFNDKMTDSSEFRIDIDGGAQWNLDEFDAGSQYVDGSPYYAGYKINTTGSGELFRVGLEVKVQGGRYGLQEIDINSAIGRLTA